jgi:hypothetical protein
MARVRGERRKKRIFFDPFDFDPFWPVELYFILLFIFQGVEQKRKGRNRQVALELLFFILFLYLCPF